MKWDRLKNLVATRYVKQWTETVILAKAIQYEKRRDLMKCMCNASLPYSHVTMPYTQFTFQCKNLYNKMCWLCNCLKYIFMTNMWKMTMKMEYFTSTFNHSTLKLLLIGHVVYALNLLLWCEYLPSAVYALYKAYKMPIYIFSKKQLMQVCSWLNGSERLPSKAIYDKLEPVWALVGPFLCKINSCSPSATYMPQWIRSAMVQIIACRLFGAKPLSKPMLGYCQLDL